jgi:membrane-associated protease RseP (regulator of RpoE activity)
MLEINLELISIILFYSLIALFFIIKRKKVEVQGKILFLYKTKRFNNLLKKIGTSCPRFWKWFGYAGIPIGFVVMALIFGYLLYSFLKLFIVPNAVPTLSLVIPGVHIPGSSIFIPFWYCIISLFIVILVHEGAHGVVATALKQKIKSAGVGILAVLPLAFVEPDEKQLQKQSAKTQLAVFSAGTMANFVTAAIVLLLASFVVAPIAGQVIMSHGTYVESVTSGLPAEIAGLHHSQIITQIDGQDIITVEDFVNYMKSVKPGQAITIQADGKSYQITTIADPQNASVPHMGIQFKQNVEIKPELVQKFGKLPWSVWYFLQLLYWIFTLNIGIGAINLLPLGPIDGGRMANIALSKGMKNKERAKKLFSLISMLSLVLLLANILGPYLIRAL